MTALVPPNHEAALALWRHYVDTHPDVPSIPEPAVEQFGDSPQLADDLLALILRRTKRATAGLVADYETAGEPVPGVGGHCVVCDSAGRPQCVTRTVDVRTGPLDSVDAAFAWDEGEGDRTRESWLAEHERFFRGRLNSLGLPWSRDVDVVFERFEVVWPQDVAE
ncbi:ASCH domain-containing protein [Mycobacterium sp. NBC_00419]|uniref:ASCH domain-containing protein n=1 Tax=Mycobacterium sp. NBC_00419 TaxID=2975989 RepID=UPI002E1C024F